MESRGLVRFRKGGILFEQNMLLLLLMELIQRPKEIPRCMEVELDASRLVVNPRRVQQFFWVEKEL